MRLEKLKYDLSIVKVSDIKDFDFSKEFYFVAKTDEEISIVAKTKDVPDAYKREDGYKALRVVGELDFNLIGILAEITGTLAENGIPVFAMSTFNTDYILIKKEFFEKAVSALKRRAYDIDGKE